MVKKGMPEPSHLCTYICTHVHEYLYADVYAQMSTLTCVYVSLCMCAHTYVCAQAYTVTHLPPFETLPHDMKKCCLLMRCDIEHQAH